MKSTEIREIKLSRKMPLLM